MREKIWARYSDQLQDLLADQRCGAPNGCEDDGTLIAETNEDANAGRRASADVGRSRCAV